MVSMKWIYSVFYSYLAVLIMGARKVCGEETRSTKKPPKKTVLCNTDVRRWSLVIKIKYVEYAAGTV